MVPDGVIRTAGISRHVLPERGPVLVHCNDLLLEPAPELVKGLLQLFRARHGIKHGQERDRFLLQVFYIFHILPAHALLFGRARQGEPGPVQGMGDKKIPVKILAPPPVRPVEYGPVHARGHLVGKVVEAKFFPAQDHLHDPAGQGIVAAAMRPEKYGLGRWIVEQSNDLGQPELLSRLLVVHASFSCLIWLKKSSRADLSTGG